MFKELKALGILSGIAIGIICIGLITYLQIRIISDCGWFGLLKGAEWVWFFGGCN